MDTSSFINTTTVPSRKTTSKSHVTKPTTQKSTAQKSRAQKSHVAKPTTQKLMANKTTAITQKSKATKKQTKDTQYNVGGTPTSMPKSYPRPGRPPSPHGIGQFARTLLATAISYDAIIARIRTKFPNAKTSVQCLRWYATKMREENVDMPNRPRKPRKDHSAIDPK